MGQLLIVKMIIYPLQNFIISARHSKFSQRGPSQRVKKADFQHNPLYTNLLYRNIIIHGIFHSKGYICYF